MWQGQTPEPWFLWTVWENQQLGGGGSPGKGLLYSPPVPACFSLSSGAVLTGAPAQPCPPGPRQPRALHSCNLLFPPLLPAVDLKSQQRSRFLKNYEMFQTYPESTAILVI